MKRKHYSKEPLIFRHGVDISNDTNEQPSRFDKPKGFWYSCEHECDLYGWFEWCIDESFRIECLTNVTELDLSQLNILSLTNDSEIKAFRSQYRAEAYYKTIDWDKVSKQYDGIEIYPYSWDLRLNEDWYYSWDCASGCIWNLGNVNLKTVELSHAQIEMIKEKQTEEPRRLT